MNYVGEAHIGPVFESVLSMVVRNQLQKTTVSEMNKERLPLPQIQLAETLPQ